MTDPTQPAPGKRSPPAAGSRKGGWVLKAVAAAVAFAGWLLFGGDLSTTGAVVAVALVVVGGLLIWASRARP